MHRVRPHSILSRHAQVQVWMLRHIVEGRWPTGHEIPTHEQVRTFLQTSRITVELARRKLIASKVLQAGSGRRSPVLPGAKRIARGMLDELHERLTGPLASIG